MVTPDEVTIEIAHKLDQEATLDCGENMYRGIYTIRRNGAPIERGSTSASFVQPSTAEMGARRRAEKAVQAMFGKQT
jgi:hypothetical protein